jgi:hypothetical protein
MFKLWRCISAFFTDNETIAEQYFFLTLLHQIINPGAAAA